MRLGGRSDTYRFELTPEGELKLLTSKQEADDVLTVTVSPGGVTPRLEQSVKESEEGGLPFTAVAKFLVAIVEEWDLEGDSGVIPLTEDGLAELPGLFLSRLMSAILEASRPVGKGRSSRGSRREGK